MLKGLPILKDMHAQPVTSQLQAARLWQQHFGTLELPLPSSLQTWLGLRGISHGRRAIGCPPIRCL
eukprot:7798580-Pyramimonas_sp.AAC.1